MKAINELLSIIKNLRDPVKGCEWDRSQSIESIAHYTLEEVYEVLESIENRDMDGLCDELGDLLFHIVFYAEMAAENSYFDFEQIVKRVSNKLRRRHPHVFAEHTSKDINVIAADIKMGQPTSVAFAVFPPRVIAPVIASANGAIENITGLLNICPQLLVAFWPFNDPKASPQWILIRIKLDHERFCRLCLPGIN